VSPDTAVSRPPSSPIIVDYSPHFLPSQSPPNILASNLDPHCHTLPPFSLLSPSNPIQRSRAPRPAQSAQSAARRENQTRKSHDCNASRSASELRCALARPGGGSRRQDRRVEVGDSAVWWVPGPRAESRVCMNRMWGWLRWDDHYVRPRGRFVQFRSTPSHNKANKQLMSIYH
jgi:hypothetical protein